MVSVKETFSLEDILGDATGVIDEFIKEQFEEADIAFGSKRDYDLEINPSDDRILKENEHLIVIHSRKPTEEETET